jgi:hypothetical protein
MFEGVERPRHIIYCIVSIEISDIFWSPISDALLRRMGLRNINLPSGHLTKRLSLRRWSVVLWSWKAMWNIFSNLGIEKATFTISLKWFLCRRMTLGTHNLPSGRLKKRLWWSRWSDVLGVRGPRENIFCILCIKKATFMESKYDLSRRVALRTHNLPCGHLKKRLWFRKRNLYQGVKGPCEM